MLRICLGVRAATTTLRVFLWAAALATLAASLFLVIETARYLSFDPFYAFLVERPVLTSDRVWRACFYVHIAGGLACLLSAPLLLWNGIRNGSTRLHRAAGRVHAVAALGWLGPTGFYLACFAKGGLAGQTGFMVLATLFYLSTVLGVRAIQRGHRRAHVVWMIRSYALILSAVSFRILYPLLHALGSTVQSSYVASTWAGLAVSIVAGELACGHIAPTKNAATVLPGVNP